MSCASCGKHKSDNGYYIYKMLDVPPYGATDVRINGDKASIDNWKPNRNKLLLFYSLEEDYPETMDVSPIEWYAQELHEDLNTDVYICMIRNAGVVTGMNLLYSYILPVRLNLISGGELKNANVFVGKNGEVTKQEILPTVKRRFIDLIESIKEYEGVV